MCEGIYGKRPWKVYGEKPADAVEVKAGSFNEGKIKYSAKDIRFTSSKDGKTLYAFCLGVPTEDIRILSLGKNSKLADKAVVSIQLLGDSAKVVWKQETDALEIKKPAAAPNTAALGYKISFAE